jgi:hypothetical protein
MGFMSSKSTQAAITLMQGLMPDCCKKGALFLLEEEESSVFWSAIGTPILNIGRLNWRSFAL